MRFIPDNTYSILFVLYFLFGGALVAYHFPKSMVAEIGLRDAFVNLLICAIVEMGLSFVIVDYDYRPATAWGFFTFYFSLTVIGANQGQEARKRLKNQASSDEGSPGDQTRDFPSLASDGRDDIKAEVEAGHKAVTQEDERDMQAGEVLAGRGAAKSGGAEERIAKLVAMDRAARREDARKAANDSTARGDRAAQAAIEALRQNVPQQAWLDGNRQQPPQDENQHSESYQHGVESTARAPSDVVEDLKIAIQEYQQREGALKNGYSGNPPAEKLSFIPCPLNVDDRPELSAFPQNVLFGTMTVSNDRPVLARAVYEPDVTSLRTDGDEVSLSYINIYGGDGQLQITYDTKRGIYSGKKVIRGVLEVLAWGSNWNEFFSNFTRLGLTKGEACMFGEEDQASQQHMQGSRQQVERNNLPPTPPSHSPPTIEARNPELEGDGWYERNKKSDPHTREWSKHVLAAMLKALHEKGQEQSQSNPLTTHQGEQQPSSSDQDAKSQATSGMPKRSRPLTERERLYTPDLCLALDPRAAPTYPLARLLLQQAQSEGLDPAFLFEAAFPSHMGWPKPDLANLLQPLPDDDATLESAE